MARRWHEAGREVITTVSRRIATPLTSVGAVERVTGVEPAPPAWKSQRPSGKCAASCAFAVGGLTATARARPRLTRVNSTRTARGR